MKRVEGWRSRICRLRGSKFSVEGLDRHDRERCVPVLGHFEKDSLEPLLGVSWIQVTPFALKGGAIGRDLFVGRLGVSRKVPL